MVSKETQVKKPVAEKAVNKKEKSQATEEHKALNTEETSETAAETNEIKEEHTLYSEPIGHIGNFVVTNSLLNSWLALAIVIALAFALRKRIKEVPGKLQSIFEMAIDYLLGVFDGVTGNRKKSLSFAPFVLAFFFFILINNWLGLLPGVGSIGNVVSKHGEKLFIPYFRGGTADLNTTLALAIIAVVASHIFGTLTIGAWKYFNKFVNIKILLEIPKKVMKDPTVLIVNPIKAFVGIVEIIGEFAKVASLTFRLFGNIFAGEVLLASMSAILAFGIPIPFMFLEIVVGLIQALIFSILVLIYLNIAATAEEH